MGGRSRPRNDVNGSLPCHVLAEWNGGESLPSRDQIRAFARCRNESLRLPAFLRHYRQLGVDRFFVVDNDSSDGSADYLAAQPDVRLFRTSNRYGDASSGTAWLNALLAQFGVGGWCLTVDIDELLVFPGSENTSLRTFTTYLDRQGIDALACLLLDLYPAGPLEDCAYTAGDDLLKASPFFDIGPYSSSPGRVCPAVEITGGVRERVFYPEFRTRGIGARLYEAMFHNLVYRTAAIRERRWLRARRPPTPPLLSKVPLVRWDATSRYLKSTHRVTPKTVAAETGVLLHFKFLQDFHARAVQEASRGEYSSGAFDYRRYARRLSENPGLTLIDEGSVRFEGSSQLVRLGLIHDTEAWRAHRAIGTT